MWHWVWKSFCGQNNYKDHYVSTWTYHLVHRGAKINANGKFLVAALSLNSGCFKEEYAQVMDSAAD